MMKNEMFWDRNVVTISKVRKKNKNFEVCLLMRKEL